MLIQTARALLLAGSLLTGAVASAQDNAPIAVDLELVLAVDVSNSVDDGENALQRAGYVDALGHPDVWEAIRAGTLQRIAVTYIEWAGPEKQKTVLPWHLIDGAEAAIAAATRLAEPPIMFTRGTGTSISAALLYSAALFDGNGFEGRRRVIDISGDGPNNRGDPVTGARDTVLSDDITINGLPLMLRPSRTFADVDVYYRDCVVGGPSAFVLPVFQPDQLATAIRHKLVLEIAGREAPPRSLLSRVQSVERADCRIGDLPPARPSPG